MNKLDNFINTEVLSQKKLYMSNNNKSYKELQYFNYIFKCHNIAPNKTFWLTIFNYIGLCSMNKTL